MKKLLLMTALLTAAITAMAEHPREFLFCSQNGEACLIMPPSGTDPVDPRKMSRPLGGPYLGNVCCDMEVDVVPGYTNLRIDNENPMRMKQIYCSNGINAYIGETNPLQWVFGNNLPYPPDPPLTPGVMLFPFRTGTHWHPYFQTTIQGTYRFSFQLQNSYDINGNQLQNSKIYNMTFLAGPVNTLQLNADGWNMYQRRFKVKAMQGSTLLAQGEGAVSSDGKIKFSLNAPGTVNICVKVDGCLSVKVMGVVLNTSTSSEKFIGEITPPLGDTNGDDVIDDFDLNNVNGSFGSSQPEDNPAIDINNDGVIDDFDLNYINGSFGSTGECL